jgi:hypothetical protein
MLSPFLTGDATSPQEINQSMVGVLSRLLTATKTGQGRYDVHMALNVVAWPPWVVRTVVKGVSVGFVAALALLCRTRTDRRDDPRLLGEFSLVVLTMLFLSERSWKHHYVTVLLPYTYLMGQFAYAGMRLWPRVGLSAGLWGSVILMATTSTELGGLFAHHQGHKIAQGYGMFLWAGVLLYALTAWRVYAERLRSPSTSGTPSPRVVPTPHLAAGRRAVSPS